MDWRSGLLVKEIRLLEIGGATQAFQFTMFGFRGTSGANLIGKPYIHYMALFAAANQPQHTVPREPPHGVAHRSFGFLNSARQPLDGELELTPAFQPGVAQEVIINGAVVNREAETRNEDIFELFPGLFGVCFDGFH